MQQVCHYKKTSPNNRRHFDNILFTKQKKHCPQSLDVPHGCDGEGSAHRHDEVGGRFSKHVNAGSHQDRKQQLAKHFNSAQERKMGGPVATSYLLWAGHHHSEDHCGDHAADEVEDEHRAHARVWAKRCENKHSQKEILHKLKKSGIKRSGWVWESFNPLGYNECMAGMHVHFALCSFVMRASQHVLSTIVKF